MWQHVDVGDLVEIQPLHSLGWKMPGGLGPTRGVVLRTETEEGEHDVLDRGPVHWVEVYWMALDGANEIEWFLEDQLTKITIH